MNNIEQLKHTISEYYQSNFMKNMIQNSCIFHDRFSSIYKLIESGKVKDDFHKRLINGRIGEIHFFESDIGRRFFKYQGDTSIYDMDFNAEIHTDYSNMDFISKYGAIGVDVKMVQGTSIRNVMFRTGNYHNEQLFDANTIDGYLCQIQYPFLLIYSDFEFLPNEHCIFVDLNTAKNDPDAIDSFSINGKKKYRINLDYGYQSIQYLYTCHEFEVFMNKIKAFYQEFLNNVKSELGKYYVTEEMLNYVFYDYSEI